MAKYSVGDLIKSSTPPPTPSPTTTVAPKYNIGDLIGGTPNVIVRGVEIPGTGTAGVPAPANPGVFTPGLTGSGLTPPGGVAPGEILAQGPPSPVTGAFPIARQPDVTVKPKGFTSPDTLEAKRALDRQLRIALRTGVDADKAKAIAAGEKPNIGWRILGNVINFDIIPGKGEITPIRTAVIPAITTLDTGRRAVLSTLKEVGDEVAVWRGKRGRGELGPESGGTYKYGAGGFSWKEWLDQMGEDSTIGYGDFVDTGNIWVDRILGGVGDAVLDPISWGTGPGGLAKTAVRRGVAEGTEGAARAIAREAERAAAVYAKQVADDAIKTAATAAAKKAAEEASEAAAKELARITSDVAGETARRTLGANAREALAEEVRAIRADALETVNTGIVTNKTGYSAGAVGPAGAPVTATAQQLDAANRVVAALTDDVIAKIATEGYAGVLGSVSDILRGVRTEAADVLGIRGGVRFVNPLQVVVGPSKVTLPGTERLTNLIGKGVSQARVRLVQTPFGEGVLTRIIPRGEGGLFGSADVFAMRQGLRSGSLKGAAATDAVQLLEMDKLYRSLVKTSSKEVGAKLNAAYQALGGLKGKNGRILNGLVPHLSTDPSEWVARGLRKLNPEEQSVYDATRKFFDDVYDEAQGTADLVTGAKLPKNPNYFPRVQTADAIEWAAANPQKADKLAQGLGVDRTWFTGNFSERTLGVGDTFFGVKLTAADVAGGPARFNEIARTQGKLKFDFFETDTAKVIAGYARNHANFMAYMSSFQTLQNVAPNMVKKLGYVPTRYGATTPPDPKSLDFVLSKLGADSIEAWDGETLSKVAQGLTDLLGKLDPTAPIIVRSEIEDGITAITDRIRAVDAGIAAGTVEPISAALTRSEIENYATLLANYAQASKVGLATINPTVFKNMVKLAEDGFAVLNEVTAPNVIVREDLMELFTNVKRLDDPQFARAAEAALKDFNQFFKSYVVATPGFHTRNSLGNLWAAVASGANPALVAQGLKVQGVIDTAFKEGGDLFSVSQALQKAGYTQAQAEAATAALRVSGATGFGQFGEIAADVGARETGVLGGAATGNIPFTGREMFPGAKQASAALGTPIGMSRKAGSWLEERMRFALVYESIIKGASPSEAAARASKYLVDYNDLSTLDRNLKQIVPFWMWISRNVPLQMENMWTFPKAYQQYANFRRNTEDKDGTSMFIPDFLKETGAFKLPETGTIRIPGTKYLPFRDDTDIGIGIGPNAYIRPQLGFPGVGEVSPIQELVESPEKLLSRTTPLINAPLQAIANKQFFNNSPIAKEASEKPTQDRLVFVLRQLGAPLSPIKRLADTTSIRRNKLWQSITGATSDEADPKAQEANSLLSFIGLPLFQLTPKQEQNEIWRRFFMLLDEIEKVEAKKKEERGR